MSAGPEALPDEQWKHHPRWRKYTVSAEGRVRDASTGQLVPQHRHGTRGRYRAVRISGKSRYVHELVLETFHGERPPGEQACHANDVGHDNRLENLRWDTRSANARDKVANGRDHNAVKTHCPHGHAYADCNVRSYGKVTVDGLGSQRRTCMACARARSWASKRRRNSEPVTSANIRHHADWQYGRIMAECGAA